MIMVIEEAKMLLKHVEHSEGTVLGLDPVDTHPENGKAQIGLRFGKPTDDNQVVEHEERDLLCISWSVSEALNESTLHLVQTPEGPDLGIDPPKSEPPVPDGS